MYGKVSTVKEKKISSRWKIWLWADKGKWKEEEEEEKPILAPPGSSKKNFHASHTYIFIFSLIAESNIIISSAAAVRRNNYYWIGGIQSAQWNLQHATSEQAFPSAAAKTLIDKAFRVFVGEIKKTEGGESETRGQKNMRLCLLQFANH